MKMKKILPTHGCDRHFHFIGLVDKIMCNGIFIFIFTNGEIFIFFTENKSVYMDKMLHSLLLENGLCDPMLMRQVNASVT